MQKRIVSWPLAALSKGTVLSLCFKAQCIFSLVANGGACPLPDEKGSDANSQLMLTFSNRCLKSLEVIQFKYRVSWRGLSKENEMTVLSDIVKSAFVS